MKRHTAYHELIYHFVWGTKNRLSLISPAVEGRLFPYIGYKCKQLGYELYAINGTEDHLHCLLRLPPTVLVADVAKNLKGASSHYINNESGLNETLYWQDGYAALTIRSSEIPKVVHYILNQKEHHKNGNLSKDFEKLEE